MDKVINNLLSFMIIMVLILSGPIIIFIIITFLFLGNVIISGGIPFSEIHKMDSYEKQQELELWSEKVSDEIILGNHIYWNNGSIEVGPIRSATGYIYSINEYPKIKPNEYWGGDGKRK